MSLQIALSGLNAASNQLDVTANNIANAETTGFKLSRASFTDVFSSTNASASSPGGLGGVQVGGMSQQFTQGNLQYTDDALDLAINGDGFFTMQSPEGTVYSRAGEFTVDSDGFVVNQQNQRLQSFPVGANGQFSTGRLEDLKVDNALSAPKATELADVQVSLPGDAAVPAVADFDPSLPASYNHATSMTVYDSLGASHTASLYFAKSPDANNTWVQHLFVDGEQLGDSNELVFDELGSLQAPADGRFSYPDLAIDGGAAPLSLTFDFNGSQQFGSEFSVSRLSQDGFESGQLTGLTVGQDGVVSARYSNRQNVALGKVAITQFANPSNLQQLGSTTWAASAGSGEPRLGESGTSNFGLIQSGALEGSNVDITEQLVQMITAQRNFQANAKSLSTSDAITQEILNIR